MTQDQDTQQVVHFKKLLALMSACQSSRKLTTRAHLPFVIARKVFGMPWKPPRGMYDSSYGDINSYDKAEDDGEPIKSNDHETIILG